MADHYSDLPSSTKIQPSPFKVAIPDDDLRSFKELLKISRIGPTTYENLQEDARFGISKAWLQNAKTEWENFDWRTAEAHINSFPNFKSDVEHDGETFSIHFIALFSSNPAAIPVVFLHGWPGSFLEFLPILSTLKSKYPNPHSLPYHIIVPSLPGFTFSSGPSLNKDSTAITMSAIIHSLLTAHLGFPKYIAQGGDIGSKVGRLLAIQFPECVGVHINFIVMREPDPPVSGDTISIAERDGLARAAAWQKTGTAYAMEHGTRPATIGLALSASPIALLCWIGEKFIEWTDVTPPLHTILEAVTLYYLTDTFPRSIYTYRRAFAPEEERKDAPDWDTRKVPAGKAFGYSWFPKELLPMPRAWVETMGEQGLTFFRQHDAGGHFAALERPETLLGDFEDFVKESWKA
ncbi:MAG: hypothetical protein M1820_001869 [Bogoriella megaspora]|nr:MAG: hypothetical protein M1820_001869 [Bogoriella megaspora]